MNLKISSEMKRKVQIKEYVDHLELHHIMKLSDYRGHIWGMIVAVARDGWGRATPVQSGSWKPHRTVFVLHLLLLLIAFLTTWIIIKHKSTWTQLRYPIKRNSVWILLNLRFGRVSERACSLRGAGGEEEKSWGYFQFYIAWKCFFCFHCYAFDFVRKGGSL